MHLNLANLLAAMAILTVLALSLAPFALETGAVVAVEFGAQQLAQELQAVRQLAVAQNQTYDVYFEWARRSYFIKPANMSPGRRVHIPAGVDWYGDYHQKLTIYNTGRCNQGGSITVLHPQSGQRIKITVATRTGRIKVERGQ